MWQAYKEPQPNGEKQAKMYYRLNNWPQKLNEFIEARRATPFEWGKNDCSLFVADAIMAMTGIDVAKELRGKYSTEIGAYKIISEYGEIEDVVEALGCPIKLFKSSVATLARGDIALVVLEGNKRAIGINLGRNVAFTGKNGLEFVSIRQCVKGWGFI